VVSLRSGPWLHHSGLEVQHFIFDRPEEHGKHDDVTCQQQLKLHQMKSRTSAARLPIMAAIATLPY
jgi:hypothetical protein